jgi:hypothetical protein
MVAVDGCDLWPVFGSIGNVTGDFPSIVSEFHQASDCIVVAVPGVSGENCFSQIF